MPDTVLSATGVPIRLTDERWLHVAEGHNEVADLRLEVLETVRLPERIMAGRAGELLAIREWEPGRWIVVVYKELNGDGFIITAFTTSGIARLQRRRQIWP